MKTLFSLFLFFFGLHSGIAQNITAKIVDHNSGESIPYANIKVNGTLNLISNDEGNFNLTENQSDPATVLTISHLGYSSQKITVGELKNQQFVVKLVSGTFELETLTVSTVKPDPYVLMANVKKQLDQNYKADTESSKNMLFYREANAFRPSKLDLNITKSTGFTKSNLKAANTDLKAFSSKLIAKPPQEFKNMLCNYYLGKSKKDNNTWLQQKKLEVVKATLLKGEENSLSLEDMQDTGAKILLKHLDTTKYYRIKSGLFGSRDTISLRKNYNSKKKKKKPTPNNLTASKTSLNSFLLEQHFKNPKMEFVNQPELYEYIYDRKIYNDEDNTLVYVLKFKPKKSKAKYTGKLYISEADYAVIRCDYALSEGKKVSGFNMKFLLGVKSSENVSKGTVIYKKNKEEENYYLQYASAETGQYIYINRPLKFIELTDEERDVVALDLKIEGNVIDKTEYLNITRSDIEETAYENTKEEDFKYTYLKRYDPTIWKNYLSIEPLEEMKQYRVTE